MKNQNPHLDTVREQFAVQAEHFGDTPMAMGNEAYQAWSLAQLPLGEQDTVLDVAAGTCLITQKLARRVKHVVALDATPDMLQKGMEQARVQGIGNLLPVIGEAEHLPFLDDMFDLVVSRLLLHHVVDVDAVLSEMARVCKPGGTVAVIDLVCVAPRKDETYYNELERLRDPSHTRALYREELSAACRRAGLTCQRESLKQVEAHLMAWMALTHTNEEDQATIRQALLAELSGGRKTGFAPYGEADALRFTQNWAMVVCQKQA